MPMHEHSMVTRMPRPDPGSSRKDDERVILNGECVVPIIRTACRLAGRRKSLLQAHGRFAAHCYEVDFLLQDPAVKQLAQPAV